MRIISKRKRRKFMKLKFLSLPLLSLALIGCTWTPVNKDYKIREKTTFSDFSSLNKPVIITSTLSQTFEHNEYSTTRRYGSLLAIYDWESNSVYDYVYSPDRSFRGIQVLMTQATLEDNSSIFYGLGEYNLNYITPDGSSIKIQAFPKNSLFSTKWAAKEFAPGTSPILFSGHYDYTDNKLKCRAIEIDPVTKKTREGLLFDDSWPSLGDLSSVTDSNGTVWVIYRTDRDENEESKTVIKKLNKTTLGLENSFAELPNMSGTYDIYDGWENRYYYELLYADTENLVLRKHIYTNNPANEASLVTINLSTKQITEIDFGSDKSIRAAARLNGKLYAFTGAYDEKWSPYEINISTATATKVSAEIAIPRCDDTFIRGNKIFFVDSYDGQINIYCFDAQAVSFTQVKTITLGDL